MVYGYARVSCADQNLSRQLSSFAEFGINEKNIFCDKKSGKDFCREAYLKMVKKIKKGDLLVIKSIDRLGRDYSMITTEWNRLVNVIKADILVLDMPLLDTREKDNSLMGRFIADVVLQVLSFVAENERQNIRARQKEGIKIAKMQGVKFGRPEKKLDRESKAIFKLYYEGKIKPKEAIRKTGLKSSLFYYHYKKYLILLKKELNKNKNR